MGGAGGADQAHPRAVEGGVLAGHPHGDRIDVDAEDGGGAGSGGGDGQNAGAASQVEHPPGPALLARSVEGFETHEGGGVVAGAEGRAGLDPQGQRVGRDRAAVVGPVDEEPAGPHRRQAREREREPVGVGEILGRQGEGEGAKAAADAVRLGAVERPRVEPPQPAGLVLLEVGTGGRFEPRVGLQGGDGGAHHLGRASGADLDRLADYAGSAVAAGPVSGRSGATCRPPRGPAPAPAARRP